MTANNNCQGKTGVNSLRSYFDWDCNMQVVQKGNGEIAMTEGELARCFGVLGQTQPQTANDNKIFQSASRCEGSSEEPVFIGEQLEGYAPLYPLPTIIILSFLLDSTEAHLFRKYVYQKLQKCLSMITPIFLIDNTDN